MIVERSPTIFVVDDDEAMRRALVDSGKFLQLPVREFASAEEFLASYDTAMPGCLVLDIRMPGMSGLELQRQLTADGTSIPIVLISAHADVRTAVDVMTRGAVSLLEKPFRLDELHTQIRRALELDAGNRAAKARRSDADARLSRLNTRDLEVFDRVAAGKTNKEIAAELGLSVRAVEDRRARLMKKVEVDTVAELIQLRFPDPTPR